MTGYSPGCVILRLTLELPAACTSSWRVAGAEGIRTIPACYRLHLQVLYQTKNSDDAVDSQVHEILHGGEYTSRQSGQATTIESPNQHHEQQRTRQTDGY